MSLQHYMKSVACVSPRATIADACREMQQRQVGCVVVLSDDGKPIGVLTDRDVAIHVVAEGRPADSTTVDTVMTTGVITLPQTATLQEATTLMRDRGVRRIPILDGTSRICGIVSFDDLLLLLGMEIGNLAGAIFAEQVSQPLPGKPPSGRSPRP